jgi:hypothetical protein
VIFSTDDWVNWDLPTRNRYINGAPYCLRREGWSLRNMKDYGGISKCRLEVLEERLRDDVVNELEAFGGR